MQSLVDDFRALKLHGMAEALPDILAKPGASGNSLDTVLRKLVRAEQSDRQVTLRNRRWTPITSTTWRWESLPAWHTISS